MNAANGLSAVQKITAFIFAAALLAVLCFIAVRIVQKPAYEENERIQCNLLALSAAELFAKRVSDGHTAEDIFGSERELAANHKEMPGNWVVKFNLIESPYGTFIRASASSGWNSRSPKSVSFDFTAGAAGGVRYMTKVPAAMLADVIKADKDSDGRIISFKLPYEKDPAVSVEGRVTALEFGGKKFIILK